MLHRAFPYPPPHPCPLQKPLMDPPEPLCMPAQVTSTARQAFRRAVLEAGPRLVEAMFLCQVSTASEALSGALHF